MACLQLIALLFGSVPGDVVEIPRSRLEGYTPAQIRWAKLCAARHGIRYRIVER